MAKYKFEDEDSAIAAQEEIVENGWVGVSEQSANYIRTKTHELTSDLIIDIEKIIKKHGGKAKIVT